jgi:putative ABC transport system permease protein
MKLLRKLSRNWQWVLINIAGLALAYACVSLVFSHAKAELSYDSMHSKADRIYRATTSANGPSLQHPARVWGRWIPELPNQYAAVEDLVRLVPFKKGVVEIGNERFYSDNLFRVDSSFFEVFDFELLSKQHSRPLSRPAEAVVSRSLAIKYFGSLDVLGKELEITHQQTDSAMRFTVVGVMEDIPPNAHFHADILTTLPNMVVNESWGYTYYLMKEGTDVEALRAEIQAQWDANLQQGQLPITLHFQKLTDIHLHSHKTREIEPNGNVRSLVLLISGAAIILFIALINFLNLSRVQFIAGVKAIKIKMINGATKADIARELLLESLVISLSAIALGLCLAYNLSGYLSASLFVSLWPLIIISLLFIGCIAVLSVYPLFTSKVVSDTKVSASSAGMYTFPLVIQFTLAVIAITGTLVLQRQINFLNEQHPQATNEDVLVIERNAWTVVQRYEQLRNELLKDPSIKGVTGAMEEPGGDILDNFPFEMEGIEPRENQSMYILTTDANFLSTMGIKPLAGTVELDYIPSQEWEHKALELSTLENAGSTDQAQLAALREEVGNYREQYILNETALKMLGIEDPEDAIGRAFKVQFQFPRLFPPGKIVGVVPDFHYTNLFTEERPLMIVAKKVFSYNFLIHIDPMRKTEALATLEKVWNEVNPEFPLEYSKLTDAYQKVYAREYAQTRVLSLFALISVVLSALGIYAIAAFNMQKRVKEIGVRKVNGASIGEIMLMLNKKFILWVTLAFVLAVPISWYMMQRWLENFAYKIALSWWMFAAAGGIAMTVALLTVSILAYRAATRNPVDSLRYE